MIFWDSRLIHCSTHALTVSSEVDPQVSIGAPLLAPLRLAAYISMTPRDWATDEVIQTRVKAYCLDMTTSHWSHILSYTIPVRAIPMTEKDINETDEQIRRLIGL
jgi:hypothetical protein